MRMTIDVDERLLEKARRLTGIVEPTALIHAALRALVHRESVRRLASLGGRDPQAKAPRRRRSE
jgi:Arc/MetJ family transcription regulator